MQNLFSEIINTVSEFDLNYFFYFEKNLFGRNLKNIAIFKRIYFSLHPLYCTLDASDLFVEMEPYLTQTAPV